MRQAYTALYPTSIILAILQSHAGGNAKVRFPVDDA